MSKASQLRAKAQNFLKKGKIADAIETYKKLLQVDPRNVNLYNELGDIYLRSGDKLQAVSSFDKAVENYEKVALYNNAVAVCKKILRVVPSRAESIFKLGELKAKQKFISEASRMFIQYLDIVGTDEAGARADMILPKVESMMELVPGDDELHQKAAEVLTHLGMKIAAAEIFAGLIVRSAGGGDREKTDFYRGRLDLLREALTADEQARIEEILAQGLEESGSDSDEPDLTVEEIDPAAAAQSVGSDPDGQEEIIVETSGAGPVQQPVAGPVQEPAADGTAAAEVARNEEKDQATPPEAHQAPDTRPAAEREYVIEEGDAGGDSVESPPGATPSEDDVSAILEEEDAANEAAAHTPAADMPPAAEGGNLVEEITSDVEEDDFRSHYDLGMAYIEMALYTEAIRELQISARSEQLQLRSLEMIGHCFLELNNPRLAVKQLKRGLDIAMNTGGDNLGIHYNLGLAFEALGENEKAREHFEEVYIVDVTFRDISEKMKKYSTVS